MAGPAVTDVVTAPDEHNRGRGTKADLVTINDDAAPLVRSPVYVFRAIVGLVLIAISVTFLLVFEQALVGLADDIADLQAGFPDWLAPLLEVLVAVPMAIGIVGTNVYLLYRRKFRRWFMINLAVVAAFLLGALVTNIVITFAPESLRDAVDSSTNASLGNDGLASVVAVLTIGSVWIGTRLRPWVIGFVGAAFALSFFPDTTPVLTLTLDIGVGILAGSLVALVLKTRDRTPRATELIAAMNRSAIRIASIERASVDARGSVPWFARTVEGSELFIKTLNSDQRASDLMFRIYRMIRLRHAGDRRPESSLRASVEHEAFMSLAAQSRSIRTPKLLAVSDVGTDGMLLAYERINGRSLDRVAPEDVTDELLAATWDLVLQMQTAAIAHRDLRLANIFVGSDERPWIIDFGFAELAADDALMERDMAELITSTAVVVGTDRAVRVAVDTIGRERVASALPWIQPLALSSATRSQIGKSSEFEKLRTVAAEAAGVSDVEYEKIERVKPGTLLILASAAVALYVLIPQFAAASGFLDELASAQWTWVGVAAIFSALTYLGAGLGMVGAVPMRLAVGPMTMAQLAGSFSNRVTPAKVGGMATNVRYLQKQEIPLPVAVSAVGLNTVAGTIIHISLMVLFGMIASSSVNVPLPDARTTAIIVAAIILLSGLFMLIPIGRKLLTRYLVPALRAGASSIAAIARTPTKLIALFTGSALVTLSYTAAMIASLAAFGVDVPVAQGVFVYLAGAAVSSAAPTPGGIGATEAALVAGYTAIGVEAAPAFAAVLLFRLITFWLPILPGWLALVRLQRTGQL
jgi:undecaprenyl-diphosphatase